jgi:hypothetical protein
MGITRFYTTLFTIQRPVWANDKSSLQSVGSFYGHKQPTNPELTESLGFAMTKTFTIWCSPLTDVKAGDIINDGTYQYNVRALNNNNYLGGNTHLQIIAERAETYVSV